MVQVRVLVAAAGMTLVSLHRVRVGGYVLPGDVPPGGFRCGVGLLGGCCTVNQRAVQVHYRGWHSCMAVAGQVCWCTRHAVGTGRSQRT